jgi:hypothetical protein
LAWLVYWLDQRFGATGGEIREFLKEFVLKSLDDVMEIHAMLRVIVL